jgi:hypothetical protein
MKNEIHDDFKHSSYITLHSINLFFQNLLERIIKISNIIMFDTLIIRYVFKLADKLKLSDCLTKSVIKYLCTNAVINVFAIYSEVKNSKRQLYLNKNVRKKTLHLCLCTLNIALSIQCAALKQHLFI